MPVPDNVRMGIGSGSQARKREKKKKIVSNDLGMSEGRERRENSRPMSRLYHIAWIVVRLMVVSRGDIIGLGLYKKSAVNRAAIDCIGLRSNACEFNSDFHSL